MQLKHTVVCTSWICLFMYCVYICRAALEATSSMHTLYSMLICGTGCCGVRVGWWLRGWLQKPEVPSARPVTWEKVSSGGFLGLYKDGKSPYTWIVNVQSFCIKAQSGEGEHQCPGWINQKDRLEVRFPWNERSKEGCLDADDNIKWSNGSLWKRQRGSPTHASWQHV